MVKAGRGELWAWEVLPSAMAVMKVLPGGPCSRSPEWNPVDSEASIMH